MKSTKWIGTLWFRYTICVFCGCHKDIRVGEEFLIYRSTARCLHRKLLIKQIIDKRFSVFIPELWKWYVQHAKTYISNAPNFFLSKLSPGHKHWSMKQGILGEFHIYPILYDNWLFLFSSLLKKREEEGEPHFSE